MRQFDFTAPPAFDAPLVPDDWPIFDAVYFCSLSDQTPSPPLKSDSSLPSPAALASMPIPPSRTSPRNKNPNHIPRPRNAFMLFRSAFAAAQKISAKIEHDNRHITRIIAHCWNRLSDADKQVWRDKAAAEKAQHAARYPNYRFNPVGRTNKAIKRNVRRNGVEDVRRCEKLAELVMEGKCGQELESAINAIDNERRFAESSVSADMDALTSTAKGWAAGTTPVPPFRSPLLPPNQVTGGDPMSQSSLRVEPDTFYAVDPDLFDPQRFQFHQLDVRDGVSSASVSPFRSVMGVAQSGPAESEQPTLDYRLFPWNQSDSFSYYNC